MRFVQSLGKMPGQIERLLAIAGTAAFGLRARGSCVRRLRPRALQAPNLRIPPPRQQRTRNSRLLTAITSTHAPPRIRRRRTAREEAVRVFERQRSAQKASAAFIALTELARSHRANGHQYALAKCVHSASWKLMVRSLEHALPSV